ncbi:MAG: hypothetical protein ACN4EP_03100 [Sediminibacterium sp.]
MRLTITICLLIVFVLSSNAQMENRKLDLTEKQQFDFVNKVETNIEKLQSRLQKSINGGISKLQKQEAKLIKKIAKTDSAKAKLMLAESNNLYSKFQHSLKFSSNNEWKEYLPALDSVQTSIDFLSTGNILNDKLSKSFISASGNIKEYANSIQAAAQIQQQLKERKRLLMQQFQQFGLVKELKKLNKEFFYYQQQFNEIKSLLSDGSKLEKKVLGLIRESEAFKDFFNTNSQFSALFPGGSGGIGSPAGTTDNLQTIAEIQARLLRSGMDNMAVNNALTNAQTEPLTSAPSLRLPGMNDGEALTMPDFSPNRQKTKSFFQRIELGWNLQTRRATNILPSLADLGLSIGYKLNDNSVVGTGIAYKLGMGNGWKDIRFSHQGVGLRTYADIRIKGGFWLSGGYEKNYMQAFSRFSQINDWQHTALLGITKKLKINKKKETKIQLLYDFLNRTNGQQPLQFRYGQLF